MIVSCYKFLECQIWLTNINLFSWGNKSKLETLKDLSPYIGVSFKFVFKTIKNLSRIFLVIEYWFKALEWQIYWTNTKLFLWETEKNLGNLQNLSSYIGVSDKFVWKSVESLNRNLGMIEYWFNVLDCQICWTNIKPFFWESKANLETLEKLFPSIGVSYKMLFKSVKSLDRIFVVIEYWFKALECQIC